MPLPTLSVLVRPEVAICANVVHIPERQACDGGPEVPPVSLSHGKGRRKGVGDFHLSISNTSALMPPGILGKASPSSTAAVPKPSMIG